MESILHLVLFEWTCKYGLNPGRPLIIIVVVLLILSFPYMLALGSRDRETGIWVVLLPDRIIGQDLKTGLSS